MNNRTRDHNTSRRAAKPSGFTLIELLVVIAIIALLLGILLPSLSSAVAAGWRVACQSNARQHAVALNMYANDHDERLPISRVGPWELTRPLDENTPYLQDTLIPYVDGVFGDGNYSEVFRCPAVERGRGRANESFENGILLSDPLQNHYRYNTWEAIEYPPPPVGRDYVFRGKRITRALFPDRAKLTWDMFFFDWESRHLPHGESGGGLVISNLGANVSTSTGEEYFEQNPAGGRSEQRVAWITEGWSTYP